MSSCLKENVPAACNDAFKQTRIENDQRKRYDMSNQHHDPVPKLAMIKETVTTPGASLQYP